RCAARSAASRSNQTSLITVKGRKRKMKTQLKHRSQVRHDHFKLRGYLEYVLRDAVTGEVVGRGKKKNTVTASGRGWALERLVSASNAQILSAIAIGSSST